MAKTKYSILFLGKKGDEFTQKAREFCEANFSDVEAHLGVWGDALPKSCEAWQGDLIISYLSRWIIPDWLLKKPRTAAINFHPASPDYPGIGCNNFALYDGAKEYGATCHHMAPKVDTGTIVAVKRFPVLPTDDVGALLTRTYEYQLQLFLEVMENIRQGKPLPTSSEQWTRKPITRKEFNELGRITPEMSREEIARRVRATTYGSWRPFVEIQGFVFELKRD